MCRRNQIPAAWALGFCGGLLAGAVIDSVLAELLLAGAALCIGLGFFRCQA